MQAAAGTKEQESQETEQGGDKEPDGSWKPHYTDTRVKCQRSCRACERTEGRASTYAGYGAVHQDTRALVGLALTTCEEAGQREKGPSSLWTSGSPTAR